MPLSIPLGKNKFRPDPNVKYYSGNRLLPQGIGGLPCHFRMSGLSARGMKYSNGSQPVPQKNLSQNFCGTHGEEWDTQCNISLAFTQPLRSLHTSIHLQSATGPHPMTDPPPTSTQKSLINCHTHWVALPERNNGC